MGERGLHRDDRLEVEAGPFRQIAKRPQPAVVQVVGRAGTDQVRRDDCFHSFGTVYRDVPRVPTVTFGRGKPLVQVESSAGEPVPLLRLQAVRPIEQHDLIPSQPGGRVNHAHDAAPAYTWSWDPCSTSTGSRPKASPATGEATLTAATWPKGS